MARSALASGLRGSKVNRLAGGAVGLLLALPLVPVLSAQTLSTPQVLAGQVHDLFAVKCIECHGADLERPRGKFGYVLDLARVAANPKMVLPGKSREIGALPVGSAQRNARSQGRRFTIDACAKRPGERMDRSRRARQHFNRERCCQPAADSGPANRSRHRTVSPVVVAFSDCACSSSRCRQNSCG